MSEVKVENEEFKLVSNVVPEKELRQAQLRALKLFADTVGKTYGPMGGYTAYSFRDPNKNTKAINCYYTKDGLTALKHIDIDKPIEDILRDDIRTICTQVVKTIGDGTTSAVLLSYYVFEGMLKLQKEGYPKRQIIKLFKEFIADGIKRILESKKDCTLEDIFNIAKTSLNGNEEIAKMIENIYKECGMDVFIDVSASNTKDSKVKIYKGMTYDEGFIDPCFINNEKDKTCEMPSPRIYVFESPVDTPQMHALFQLIIEEEINKPIQAMNSGKKPKDEVHPVLIICPTISRDMNSTIDQLINEMNMHPANQRGFICVVANIDNDNQYLMDISKLTGAKLLKKYIDKKNYEADQKKGLAPTPFNIKSFAGTAEKAVIDNMSTRIINPKNMFEKDGSYTEFFKNYLEVLENDLNKYEETHEELLKIGKLKRRINILKANMVDFFVGGIGTSDRMALTDSVEDAVLNCRSAAQEGVCNGANFEGLKAFNQISIECSESKTSLENGLLKAMKDAGVVEEDEEGNPKVKDTKAFDAWIHTNYNGSELKETIDDCIFRNRVAEIILTAYFSAAVQLYKPYVDDNDAKAAMVVASTLTQKKPLNIITDEYDGTVLTSAKTEPAILDSISRIISLLFDTNQFLVPDARFNIYTMGHEEETESNMDKSLREVKTVSLVDKLYDQCTKQEQEEHESVNPVQQDISL